MNPIFAAAADVQAFCQARRWLFCFIGGLAVQRWGEPRLTRDVDLTVITGFGGEGAYVDAFLERFAARLPDAREFALRNRVLLLTGAAGTPIDVALGAMPFEERAARRAAPFMVSAGVELVTCGAEDLIVRRSPGAIGIGSTSKGSPCVGPGISTRRSSGPNSSRCSS